MKMTTKPKLLCVFFSILIILAACLAFAEDSKIEIVSQVFEKSPDGNYYQIGDYGVNKVNNVWKETTPGEKSAIPLSRIKTGVTVKAILAPQRNSDMWLAEEIILLGEPGASEPESKPATSGSDEIYNEGGVWKN